jgi:hypothetical protein
MSSFNKGNHEELELKLLRQSLAERNREPVLS